MNIHAPLIVTLSLLYYSVAQNSIDFKSKDESYSDAARKDKSILIAIVDKYTDKLFDNIHDFAITHGMDPVPLQDYNNTQIMRAHVVLTNGTFRGVSTIKRDKEVELSYKHNERVLEVRFPIRFQNLSFHYHYDVGVSVFRDKGGFTGIMKDYRVTVDLIFDFKTYHLKMAKPLWLNGNVTVKFDGGPSAIIKTVIATLVAQVLTPIIINPFLSGIVSKVGKKMVSTVNEAIDRFLHPNSTKVANYMINNL